MTAPTNNRKRLGTPKLREYHVPNKLTFELIRRMFSKEIFGKKKEDGKYYVLTHKKQLDVIKQHLGIELKPTNNPDYL